MSSNHPIVKYKTYAGVLAALIVLTLLSIAVTGIELGSLTIAMALGLASIKAALVLWHFMHLKYENKLYSIMIGLVLFVFVAVIIVTFLDYGHR